MFNLKAIYFYFLALRISLIKFLKKIYFTTKIYKKSLISKTPQQFYFHPNPLLLSYLTTYKKNTFKISEIDPNLFWITQSNIQELKEQHSFMWLNLIDRKNDGKSIQRIINLWILKYSNYKKNIWENSVLSQRIISWILNSDIILAKSFFEFKKNFLTSIIIQSNHLKKNIKFEKNYENKIKTLTALLLTGLVFKEYEENYNYAIKELEKFVKDFFDKDGFPVTRSPNDLIFFLKYLILCKECIKEAQKYIPEILDETISKNISNLKQILTPDDQIPFFNGGRENNLTQVMELMNDSERTNKNKNKIVGGLQILKFKNSLVYFDIGEPPKKDYSRSYQSGPLSFEYYLNEKKIITNCGFGSAISSKAELLSRLTSAQSTLTINDTSVSKFERNKTINRVFGNSIKNTFKILNKEILENDELIGASASHNGYDKNFGCIFKRKININKSTGNLVGIDELIKKKDGKPLKYSIRFHLYPGLTAVKTLGGDSILIQLTKNKSLFFTIKGEKLFLEKSIFLARNRILGNTCITVSGNLVNKNKIIQWEIKEKI